MVSEAIDQIAIHTVIVLFMNGITVKIISLFAWPHSENLHVLRCCFIGYVQMCFNLATNLNDNQQLWRQ